jgi:hypothetical protein
MFPSNSLRHERNHHSPMSCGWLYWSGLPGFCNSWLGNTTSWLNEKTRGHIRIWKPVKGAEIPQASLWPRGTSGDHGTYRATEHGSSSKTPWIWSIGVDMYRESIGITEKRAEAASPRRRSEESPALQNRQDLFQLSIPLPSTYLDEI